MDPALREQQRQADREAKELAAEARRQEREAAKQAKAAAVHARRLERDAAKAAKAAARQAQQDQAAGFGVLMIIAFFLFFGIILLGSGR